MKTTAKIKITIVVCSKIKDKHLIEQFNKYATRLRGSVDLQYVDFANKIAAIDKYIHTLPKQTQLIAMDEKGVMVDSHGFAKIMGDSNGDGYGHGGVSKVFLIGLAEGLPESGRQRADMLISLSKLTMSYQLAFSVLTEQIYRGHTILTGHPYSK